MNKKILFALCALSLTTIFCVMQPGGNPIATTDVGASVNATLTALAAVPTETATPTETITTMPEPNPPQPGLISGTLSYPSSFLPPMRVAAFSTTDDSYAYTETSAGQSDYLLEVPAGTYVVVSYALGDDGTPTGIAGGYTQMVPCGLSASCTDHTPIPVTVAAGETVPNIDPGDWYAGADTFPPPPIP
jgi:hypothetical protein